MAKNTGKVWIKMKEGSKESTIVKKTVRNLQLVRKCFEYNSFSLKTPKHINLKTKTALKTHKRSSFYFIVESGQPYYGQFMDSD